MRQECRAGKVLPIFFLLATVMICLSLTVDVHAASMGEHVELRYTVSESAKKADSSKQRIAQAEDEKPATATKEEDKPAEKTKTSYTKADPLTVPKYDENIEYDEKITLRPAPKGVLDFDDCVHLALSQSPFLVESAMDIRLNQISETDAWWKLLPSISIRTSYAVTRPDSSDNRYSLNFGTDSYDPVSAGFGIQAAKLVTEVAVLGHMKAISEGLNQVAALYLKLFFMDQATVLQDELVALARHEKAYLSNLLKTGGANPLEVRIAEQQVELAQLESDRLAAERSEDMEKMKTLLGVQMDDHLKLNLDDANDQVLGHFMLDSVSLEDARRNSFDLKIRKHFGELQKYKVKLAWAEFLPRPFFELRSADPIQGGGSSGLYFDVGLNVKLWTWGERYRNVKRQRMNVEKNRVRYDLESMDMETTWRSLNALYRRNIASMKVARAQVELAGLKKRQSEISYQNGTQPFPIYLEQIKQYFMARKNAILKEMEQYLALLELRHMSGHLYNGYVNSGEIRE